MVKKSLNEQTTFRLNGIFKYRSQRTQFRKIKLKKKERENAVQINDRASDRIATRVGKNVFKLNHDRYEISRLL